MTNHDLLSAARINAQGASDVVNRTSLWLQEIQAIAAVATTVGVLIALYVATVREPRKAAAESRRHKAQMDALLATVRTEDKAIAAMLERVAGESAWEVATRQRISTRQPNCRRNGAQRSDKPGKSAFIGSYAGTAATRAPWGACGATVARKSG